MQVMLSDPELGDLELGCDPYVVTQLQIGSPAVREVMRTRSLAHGVIDSTRYLGARAVTLGVRYKNAALCGSDLDLQALIDRIVPYMSPSRRPTLRWQLPGSDSVRAMTVRGADWPFTLDGPKFPTAAFQWVCPSGEIMDGSADALHCETIKPGTDVELGRTYDETYVDGGRGPYPPQDPIGSRTIHNPGTAPANWVLTIFGAVTNPIFTINDVQMAFTNNGGLVVPAGQSVVIDSREHTVWLNNVPANSRYDRLNYTAWTWDQLLLRPGDNTVRFDGTALGATASAQLCYTPTFLG